MGNPAEKTIRNPNLKRLLFNVQRGVNEKLCFAAEFCLDGEKGKFVQHRLHCCVCARNVMPTLTLQGDSA